MSHKFADWVNLVDFTCVCSMLRFKWKHFKKDITLMLVRWYLAAVNCIHVYRNQRVKGMAIESLIINKMIKLINSFFPVKPEDS